MQTAISSLEELRKLTKKSPKYHNVKTVVDGIKFDSKKEAERWTELKRLEQLKLIRHLQRQTKWPISINGVEICSYVSDFDYFDNLGQSANIRIIEDVKSKFTRRLPVYRLKKKLMKAIYDIDIKEI